MNIISRKTAPNLKFTHNLLATRFYKKSVKPSINNNKKKWLLVGGTLCCGGLGIQWYESETQARHVAVAIQRMSVATKVGVSVGLDYKRTQSKNYKTEEESIQAKRQCHQRCADRVLLGLQKLGGIYVKLGQHVSAMTYILPVEWTTTLAVLQDRCDPTPPEEIEKMFLLEYGHSIDDVFEEFDWNPIGVASLAQVHKARLRKEHHINNADDDWVAVKFQHPSLDEFCQIDLKTVSFIIDTIKRIFPDFGFEWILQEMRESLPLEMNFECEAENSFRLKKNFAYEKEHHKTALVVPDVVWAKRRILVMEFIKGARVDDLEYMKEHGIDSSQVSTEITQIFSKMMFLDGFVHCDPHPGNILIRPSQDPKSKFNFDVVLLDHGLYRTLTEQLRNDYAHLWTSLIRGDEDGIRKYSLLVGCRPESHRLFASLLTGREWSTITSADLNSDRSTTEIDRVSGRVKGFLGRIYDILETLPRIVLLLLKTSDLLRGLDETLRTSQDKYMTYTLMGKFCAEAVWKDAKANLISRIKESSSITSTFALIKHLFSAWWEYKTLNYGLRLYQFQSNTREKWSLLWKHGVDQEKKQKKLLESSL